MMHIARAAIKAGTTSILAGALALALTGCSGTRVADTTEATTSPEIVETIDETDATDQAEVLTTANTSSTGAIDATDLFSDRDLTQTADLNGATTVTLTSGQDVQVTEEGVYVISGEASDVTICVEADDSAKVQLVLDGATITNSDAPCIYVKSADKVFVTTTEGSTNELTVTGAFAADGDTSTDAVIFSKDDLVLNGLGELKINSSDNGISGKDDVKVTGGSYTITAASDGIEANDSISVADGALTITAGKDALHAENDEDDTVGFIYLCGGTFAIDATDDGIQATTVLQIDDAAMTISAVEGLEATHVQINGGTLSLSASDDGINATTKSASMGTPCLEINGGTISVTMAAGDTDALDSNGNLIIRGGTIDISAQFAFDFDGTVEFTGGTVTVNGEQVETITNTMMGGGMGPGGMGGEMGDMGHGGMAPGEGMGPQGGMGPGDTGDQTTQA